jgi:hypothetical protein
MIVPHAAPVVSVGFSLALLAGSPQAGFAAERTLDSFRRQQLSGEYFSEGANAGDLNRDGKPDVVCGPYWYEGPSFEKRHEIYPPQPQPLDFWADNFFSWVYDFNGDGWNDVFVVGFPAKPAYVYENPGARDGHWPKHAVFDAVANESPHFINIVGDERPELVCTFGGAYGYATIDWDKPFEKWTFHVVSSDKSAPGQFGHGLGVGDLSGDGKSDILAANGWFEQPAENPGDSQWSFHPTAFTNAYGGAEMMVYDVDGDGDNDVITSLAAHDFGLAWYEQDRSGPEAVFRQHIIMEKKPEQNRYGLVFTELHSVTLADIDGDGLKDIVTGKTYWSHHKQSPMWDAGAVVYWFRLERTKEGVNWVPYEADGEAGIGRQVIVSDVNGDKLPDIVVGGMKGAHVLLHSRTKVSEAQWQEAQPKPREPLRTALKRTARAPIDEISGKVPGAQEGEILAATAKASAGQISIQEMKAFSKDRWSGGQQLFWSGAKSGDRLELELDAPQSGVFDLQAVFTMARDYATIQLHLDGEKLASPLNLYNFPDVITTGVMRFGRRKLEAGKHKLVLEIVGSDPSAQPAQFVGLDYIQLATSGK